MRRLLWGLGLVLLLVACGGDSETAPTATPSRTPFEPTPLPPTWTASPPGFVPSPTITTAPDDSAADSADQPADAPSGQVQGGQQLPSTWTASPPGFVPSPTVTTAPDDSAAESADAPSGQVQGGQQLPPTWTPGAAVGRPTVTPRPAMSSSSGGEQGGASSNIPTGPPAPTWTPQPEYCNTLAPLGSDARVYVGDSVTLSWQPIPRFENYLVQIRHPGGSVVHSAIAPGGTYTVPGDVFTQANVYGWEVSAVDENGNRVCHSISGEIFTSFP